MERRYSAGDFDVVVTHAFERYLASKRALHSSVQGTAAASGASEGCTSH
jgi:hypothetical protein